ncbi:M23 family metallopeptidase [Gloeothece verrucosa]|uniref:Peptidase M23 n=1 Tax=Gloeothece verrucosa (strain PCC 7822) TaxID=497965 RepID=E0UIT2_GLOV7|nr:M23 family metallopeptidase [Gloeothece verrucosa]ADN13391.1 Peptidase M23 [Gloeothece verrucosa PCC 7822]
MLRKSSQGFNPFNSFSSSLMLKGSTAFLGAISLLSSGLIFTPQRVGATDDVVVIPETSAPTAAAEPVAAPPATQTPVIIPKARPQIAPERTTIVKPAAPLKPVIFKVEPKPAPVKAPNSANNQVQLSAPRISVPQVKQVSSPIMPQVQTGNNQNFANGIETGKNTYIDTAQYGGNAPNTYSAPAAVVLTERSTGCQTISQNGGLSGGCGAVSRRQSPEQTRMSRIAATTQKAMPPRNLTIARSLTVARQYNQPTAPSRNLIASSDIKSIRVAQPIYSTLVTQPVNTTPQRINDSQVVSLQPIEMNGLKIALAPVPRYNRSAEMGIETQAAPTTHKTDLIFPLPIPARITSAFGWRVHPITGGGRMHEGTDIGAPLGTPVLAAYPGEVAVAGPVGGYGLLVILRHLDGKQESRYGHLSEIYVQPGQQVEQGAVIGRVGSTGFSTGPHLHFEWRYLTQDGWVAVDAGTHLEYALENLIESMSVANKTTPNKQG